MEQFISRVIFLFFIFLNDTCVIFNYKGKTNFRCAIDLHFLEKFIQKNFFPLKSIKTILCSIKFNQ